MAPPQGVPGLNHRNNIGKYNKIFFLRTTWLSCKKFGMKYCVVDFYHVSSNGNPRVQNSSAGMSYGFESKIYYILHHGGARELVHGPIRHHKWFLNVYWLKPMQTQTEFLQHI